MGWFDNDQGAGSDVAPTTRPPQRPEAKAPVPVAASDGGSTLGREVHVDGTIVCGEDLTILGKVEGTIRAKGTLVIAKEADVHATIDGQRVMVHGRVEGNVHGAEKVVLGPTAHLTGNIDVSALEITEGAYFKGNVEMKPAKPPQKEEAPKPKPKGGIAAGAADAADAEDKAPGQAEGKAKPGEGKKLTQKDREGEKGSSPSKD